MKRKIYTYAFISTPLLALYGAGPFYIFDILTLKQSLYLHISVLVSVAMYWIINSYIFLYLKKDRIWQMYLISYLVTFFSNVLKAPFELFVHFRSVIEQFVFYPILMTIALNTIILLLINSLIGEREKQEAERTIAALSIQKLKAENQVLSQQLQPHFLFNALSILKSLIKENADLAEEYAVKLSDFLRYSVSSHMNDLVSLKEEIQFVSNYVDLQQIRFENAFDFRMELPDKLLAQQVPIFAIQTLVENAFKHNYFTEKRPLHIVISYEEGELQVWNNIVSLKLTERAGTGLANLKKRYAFISGKEIFIEQTETDFTVRIPLIEA